MVEDPARRRLVCPVLDLDERISWHWSFIVQGPVLRGGQILASTLEVLSNPVQVVISSLLCWRQRWFQALEVGVWMVLQRSSALCCCSLFSFFELYAVCLFLCFLCNSSMLNICCFLKKKKNQKWDTMAQT